MKRLLVVTTVHQSGDPRIALRTVGALAPAFDVTFAAQGPRPVSLPAGVEFRELPGGRVARWWRALFLMVRRWDVVSVHDPELIPAGLLARLRRNPVVLDLHEDWPAQIRTKRRVPAPLRLLLAGLARILLAVARRALHMTLAEESYRHLARPEAPVFPNHLPAAALPEPHPGDESVVYVGDITEIRGAMTLLEAVGRLSPSPRLLLVGRCRADFAAELRSRAGDLRVELDMPGFVEWGQAMTLAARAGVGVSPLHDVANYRHSLPTKLVEYAALGLPIVATELPATVAVAGDLPVVELVRPDDAEGLATAVQRALADPDLRRRAATGAGRVREQFRWPGDDVASFYGSVAR